MYNKLIYVKELRNNKELVNSIPNTSGIYKWFCDKKQISIFIDQLNKYCDNSINICDVIKNSEEIDDGEKLYCFYVGKARNLHERIVERHFRKMRVSTLRRSIHSLNGEDKQREDLDYVNNVLDNCFIQWFVTENIDELEDCEINKNDYIRLFNLKGVKHRDDKDKELLRLTIIGALKAARTTRN